MDTNNQVPPRIRRGPGKLPAIFNALRDFVVARDILPGAGLEVRETPSGRRLQVERSLLEMIDYYKQYISGVDTGGGDGTGLPGGSGGGTNPFGGGGDGTGLPDVDTDPNGDPTYNGQPLSWQTLNVCVDDGAGGYTPMVLNVYGTAPYEP